MSIASIIMTPFPHYTKGVQISQQVLYLTFAKSTRTCVDCLGVSGTPCLILPTAVILASPVILPYGSYICLTASDIAHFVRSCGYLKINLKKR